MAHVDIRTLKPHSASMAALVVLIGNGLSIAANPALRLETLTASFLEDHAEDRDDLARLLAEVDLGAVDPAQDFEGIVAGLESAEEIIRAFMRLAERVPHDDLREAAAILAERGVPTLVRRLYYAYCAEVLGAIGELTRGELADPVVAFGDWLKSMYEAHQSASMFTLNYDLLLERMLIDDNILGLRPSVTDFFSGLPERSIETTMIPGLPAIRGRLFYPGDPVPRPIRLHHLHGCLTHFTSIETGNVYKFAASDLRDLDVFGRLAAIEWSPWAPAVILGSRKVERSRDWPFAYGFLSLEHAARDARTVVVAGYSFRDIAVNARLRQFTNSERRWIVIDHRPDAPSAHELTARVRDVLGDTDVEFVLGGFGSALPQVG